LHLPCTDDLPPKDIQNSIRACLCQNHNSYRPVLSGKRQTQFEGFFPSIGNNSYFWNVPLNKFKNMLFFDSLKGIQPLLKSDFDTRTDNTVI
jgi:hypothetical protein